MKPANNKSQTPKTKETINKRIILEGFWGLGKSAVLNCFKKHNNYAAVEEPDHLKEKIKGKSKIDHWYLSKHRKNLIHFFRMPPKTIMERSILSSLAFLYANNKLKGREKFLTEFSRYYNKFNPLIVFLYADHKIIKASSKKIKDVRVKKFLQNKRFVEKYDSFFRNFLPFHYGITPIFIEVTNKTIREIKNNILAALKNNRLAQINITCYQLDKQKKPLFLLLKRNPQKGGFWQTISGGVKANNDLFKTIKLEIEEEIGLKFSPRHLLEINYSFNFIGAEGYELNEYAFGYRLLGSEKITLSHEHTEAKFVNLKEALSLLKYDSNKNIVKKIFQKIKKGG